AGRGTRDRALDRAPRPLRRRREPRSTLLLDLDGLAARVVPAVAADAMRELRLMALRTLRVGGGLRLPVGGSLVAASLALSLLRDGHGSFLPSVEVLEQALEGRPAVVGLGLA